MGCVQCCSTKVIQALLRLKLDIANCFRVATGYGQPPSTLYDWTLGASELVDANFQLPREIKARLQIEVFVDKVTKALYNNRRNPVGLAEDGERASLMSFLTRDFEELEDQLKLENDGEHDVPARRNQQY